MNVGSALNVVAQPPAPPVPAKDTRRPVDAREKYKREEDFEQLIKEEIEKKQAQREQELHMPTPLLPWLPVQNNEATGEESQSIEAAGEVAASERAAARAFAASLAAAPRPAQGASARANDAGDDALPALAEAPAPVERAAEPIQITVEAGLAPVQPLDPPAPGEPVPLARFPQVVTGVAKQLVRDNQPITQLDFQITPPHVGPVNLEVSLQERVVSVQLVVPNIQAKQMLEGQVGAIASILQAQNLTPGQVRIVTAAGGKAGAGATGQQADQGGFGLLNGGRRRQANGEDGVTGSV